MRPDFPEIAYLNDKNATHTNRYEVIKIIHVIELSHSLGSGSNNTFVSSMKFIAVPILMLLLLVQTFNTWITIIDFKINQNYIAAKLCQNRNRPQMHCNGQCVLMKKMRQHEKQEQNTPGSVKIEISSVLFASRIFFSNVDNGLPLLSKSSFPFFKTGKPVDRNSPIFHPPTV